MARLFGTWHVSILLILDQDGRWASRCLNWLSSMAEGCFGNILTSTGWNLTTSASLLWQGLTWVSQLITSMLVVGSDLIINIKPSDASWSTRNVMPKMTLIDCTCHIGWQLPSLDVLNYQPGSGQAWDPWNQPQTIRHCKHTDCQAKDAEFLHHIGSGFSQNYWNAGGESQTFGEGLRDFCWSSCWDKANIFKWVGVSRIPHPDTPSL